MAPTKRVAANAVEVIRRNASFRSVPHRASEGSIRRAHGRLLACSTDVRVAAVYVSDGQPVEYGQPLFALER